MTKKQEKIKEAYGQYWEDFKSYVDENGWIRDKDFWGRWPNSAIEWETTDHDNDYYDKRRPKSLAGLKDNNGWISISNEGLPQTDESDGFWVMSDDYTFVLDCYFDSYDKEFKIIFQKTPVVNVTHYQPIVKPKPPIY